MKRITLCLLVLGLCLPCFQQVKAQAIKGNGVNTFLSQRAKKDKSLQASFPERFCLYQINDKEYISLIMRVKPESDLSFLKKYDAIVGSHQGRIVTLRLNVEQLNSLCEEKEIIEIETSRKVANATLNNALKDLKANDVQQGLDLLQSYTGRDVLIGVADWGIDYTHPTLYDTLMEQYRVLAAWDQFRTEGPSPEGFSYGTYIEGKDQLLSYQCDTANIYDTGYHATHVAGITGGGGAGTKYRGLAIDAQWIFCSWLVDEASVMDCYTWMRNTARNLGKRIVINNSWGVYIFGYMDGSSMLDEFINNMSDNDSVVFVVSAGNNGSTPFHITADFNNNDTVRSEVKFDNSGASANYWGETVTIQGENNTNFNSRLEVYNYAWQKIYETPWLSCDGSVVEETRYALGGNDTITYRASSRYPSDHRALVDWEVALTHPNGNDHVVLVLQAENGVAQAWNVACLSKAVGNWGVDFAASLNGYVQGDDSYGVSEPGLAEKPITVASYRYKPNAWTPDISSFSSRGPNMTSYYKPEIAAPGTNIVSSINSFASDGPTSNNVVNFEGRDYYFSPLSGTSMSAPMITGTVALMLEANPNLTPEEIKTILKETARTDNYTGECPNAVWGYGKVDAYSAVKKAEEKVSLREINECEINVYPIPSSDCLNIRGLENNAEVLVLDLMGREVLNTNCVNGQINISALENGVYLLNLKDKDVWKKVKFIKK